MLFSAALSLLLATATAAPTHLITSSSSAIDKRIAENNPWILSDIVAFSATSNAGTSTVSFHFCDTNTGIELDAECKRSTAGNSVIDENNWYPCLNDTVRFRYGGSWIGIQRSYFNPALGLPYPLDEVTGYGQSDIECATTSDSTGTTATLAGVEVPMTSQCC